MWINRDLARRWHPFQELLNGLDPATGNRASLPNASQCGSWKWTAWLVEMDSVARGNGQCGPWKWTVWPVEMDSAARGNGPSKHSPARPGLKISARRPTEVKSMSTTKKSSLWNNGSLGKMIILYKFHSTR